MNRNPIITLVLAVLVALLQGCSSTPEEQAQFEAHQAFLAAEREARRELALILIGDEDFLALQPNILRGANWVECKTTLNNFKVVKSRTYCKAEIPIDAGHRARTIWVEADHIDLYRSLNNVWNKYQGQLPDTYIRFGWRTNAEGTELFFLD